MFLRWRLLYQIVLDIFIKVVNALLHARHVDFLIHFQHFLEELQIHILQFHKLAIIPDDTISAEELQTFLLLGCQLTGNIIAERVRLAFGKHLLQ